MELNKIYNENCLDTMARMEDNFVDLVVTSPPYDNIRTYNGFDFNFEFIAKELYRIVKIGGIVVWIVADATINGSETGTSFKQALYFKDIGFKLHDTMIYKKRCYMPLTHKRYEQCFEYMFVFCKGKIKTFNVILKKNIESGKKITGNRRHDGNDLTPIHGAGGCIKDFGININVWEYNTGWKHSYSDTFVKKHPAIFPEKLAEDHIISWSNPKDIVYDPFMGSGTTAKMAIANNRYYIGSEISEEYCNIANERIKRVQQELSLP